MESVVNCLSKNSPIVLAEAHVRLYQSRIQSGSRWVNASECSQYLTIWTEALAALNADRPLSKEALGEMYDAVLSGEYDEHFSRGELEQIQQVLQE